MLLSSQGRGLSSPSSPGWITVISSSKRLTRSLTDIVRLCFHISYCHNRGIPHQTDATSTEQHLCSSLPFRRQQQCWQKQWRKGSLCLLWSHSWCRRKPGIICHSPYHFGLLIHFFEHICFCAQVWGWHLDLNSPAQQDHQAGDIWSSAEGDGLFPAGGGRRAGDLSYERPLSTQAQTYRALRPPFGWGFSPSFYLWWFDSGDS